MAPRFWLVLLFLAACSKNEQLSKETGSAPPPVQSSKAGACASGGGQVDDPLSARFLPRATGDYCVDPHGETRSYGKEARGSLDQVCVELFDGECEIYKSYGLERVVTLRYVDTKGSPGSVTLNLSRFLSREGAYGFYSRRVLADSDPANTSLSTLDARGWVTLGAGIAYLWRDRHVAELSYTNELESPEQLKLSSRRVLPELAKKISSELPGPTEPPAAVAALPEARRLPLGTSFTQGDMLGVSGVGSGALGFYREGDRRWRVFAVIRADSDSAKDVLRTLKKLDGAKSLKPPPIEALELALRDGEDSPKVDWLVARRDNIVFGVGDERYALTADNAEARAKVNLSQTQKLDLLKQLIQTAAAPANPRPE
ncbi:MAG TPA: DUF6599 family protein [Polyangiaceae bacterium]